MVDASLIVEFPPHSAADRVASLASGIAAYGNVRQEVAAQFEAKRKKALKIVFWQLQRSQVGLAVLRLRRIVRVYDTTTVPIAVRHIGVR